MKVFLSTVEGRPAKDREHRRGGRDSRPIHLVFHGDDAPVKAARALVQKFGISPEELGFPEGNREGEPK